MKILYLSLLILGAVLSYGAQASIPIEKYKLENGMRVILSRDTAVPVVTIYLVYDVGARFEQKGRTGFAHLFEHMMFQGSANAPKGMHFKEVQANGGVLNGSTHPDYTDYFEELPANKLALGLWLESDRMRSLAINPQNLQNQKDAVQEERRLRLDNQPYSGALMENWPKLAFQNWQSSHSIIGSFEDLNAATVEDVAKFFKTYYAPNNVVLSIVGDIDVPETKKLIETYFGDIPAQPQPTRPDLAEPAAKPGTEVVHDAHARVPAVMIGYPGPARRSADYYSLGMLDIVLTGGDSSRFQQDLVKGKQSVIQYQADVGFPFQSIKDYKDPSLYSALFFYKPNYRAKQIVEQVQGEFEKVQRDGIDERELERARAFFRSVHITELQSTRQRAQLLATYELLDGNPELINTEMDSFLAVTPAQMQAVAKKYLTPEKRSVLEILPAPPAKQKQPPGSQPSQESK
jgi:zinc protease